MKSKWKFKDLETTRVFTTKQITQHKEPVLHVTHDVDGDWQFLPFETPDESDGVLVSLKDIVDMDQTISELWDLPLGWHAWKRSPKDAWTKEKQE